MGAGQIAQRVVREDASGRCQRLAGGTEIDVARLIVGEVDAREAAIPALALVPHRDMRCDLFVVDEPVEELTGPVGGVGGKLLGPQREARWRWGCDTERRDFAALTGV